MILGYTNIRAVLLKINEYQAMAYTALMTKDEKILHRHEYTSIKKYFFFQDLANPHPCTYYKKGPDGFSEACLGVYTILF